MYKISPKTLFIGQKIIYLPTCQSTNSYLAELSAQTDLFEGTVLITSHQTAGRGQRGNTWEAESAQNLTFSILLKPYFLAINQQFALSMTTALAVYHFLANYLDNQLKIKWSNDILYQEQKICGILIENILRKDTLEKSIVGIGININQTHFAHPNATSLRNLTSYQYDLELLLTEFLAYFEKQYLFLQNNTYDSVKNAYLAHLFGLGEVRNFYAEKEFKGKIVDVDFFGNLIIETEGIQKSFGFKEISFLF